MNERIKELEPQCWEHNEFGLNFNYQKFAELIVRDCMKVASPNYMSTPEDSVYYVEQAIDRIAEHFGVEE